MGKCLSWKYFSLLLSLLFFHSQFPFSSSLSSNSQCSALLHFNHSLSLDRDASYCGYSYPKTGSWKEDKDCCTWDGVVCDNSTRHVIALDLSCSWLYGSIPSNSTLFLLRHLRTLNLARNDFDLSLISPEFGKFQSLTHLNLSNSRFSGEIPYEISQLSSLVSLDLSDNGDLIDNRLSIETPVWKRVIGNLTQLRVLLLDFTDMSSITPNSSMMNLSSLTTLSLHECNLQGTFEMNVFRLPCIQTLDLGNNYFLEGSLPKSNLSSSSLKFLSLYMTNFSGELPDSIGSLKSLEYLYLSMCSFTGAIPTSLGNLTQMIYLDLSYNNFNGLLPSSIFDLPNLSVLDLERNQLVGPLPNHVSGLNLLIDLSLRSNFLNGTLPSWLFSLTSLMKLTLHQNQFIGEIGEFKYNNSLDYLDLSYNMIQGSIPSSISRLVNLTTLVLSSNNLQGSVPSSISRLVNLNYLDLSSNNLSIMLDLELFSNLNVFNFSYNNLFVSINNNLTFTMPNLTELYLSSCNISEFPIFLKVATNLGSLDLSNNRIHGQTPEWLGAVGRNSLSFLDLSHNFLTSIDKIPWKNLYSVDLRNNLLQGPFPTLNALNLRYLFASNNNLSRGIPSFICNASSLEVLDLSHNNFRGKIPKCLVLSNALSVLDLRMNSLNGSIPASFSCGNYLRNINLNGNQLEGPLPRSLENCTNLEVLDLGNNKINDTFPYWLGSIQKLQVLAIRSNKFQGHIGNPEAEFPFPNLRILDISNNEFNGPLPIKYFKYLEAMMNVDEGEVGLNYMGDAYYHDSLNVMIKGSYIELERIQTIFTTIDFSNNRFIGEMPQIIGRLKSLKGLNFSHNNLSGSIPSSFENLTNLEWLDLSFNKLGGEIPKQLAELPWLAVLKLSHNQLIGQIPSGKQFNTYDNDSYTDNLGLCGFPLTRSCNNHGTKQPPPSTLQQEDNLESKNGFGWQAVSIGYGCGVIFGTLMGYVMFKIGKPKWIVRMVKLEQHILLRRLKNNARRSGG
ncbi:receptor-like protein 7 [Castanea sativa]|uniref:receptor-like protein 7 n=1 Tax=Castanea sativa TaxID=21020 RepID=UPI003F64D02E